MLKKKQSTDEQPKIIIVEDDIDQMALLVAIARGEIKKMLDDELISDEQQQRIKRIQIIKVTNINALQQAVSLYKKVVMVILDCNIPDTKAGSAHDQLVKTNHRITGQLRSVDIVIEHLSDTPVTMISAMDRFQRIVGNYYKRRDDLNLNFIRKNDEPMIGRNIRYYLNRFFR